MIKKGLKYYKLRGISFFGIGILFFSYGFRNNVKYYLLPGIVLFVLGGYFIKKSLIKKKD